MSSVTITLDDTSPLIQYLGNWRAGNSAGKDPAISMYYGKTFTLTTDNTAAAQFRWHGPGQVTLYGAKRNNHDNYRVTLDGKATTGNGYSASALFQEPLFRGSVSGGDHLLVVKDEGTTTRPYLDIDKIDITTQVGGKTLTVDSRDKAFVYKEKWTDQDIGRYTGVEGASVSIRFSGNSVDIYGLVADTVGAYTVKLDNGAAQSYTAYNAHHRVPGSLLYMARGLADGPHTITITNTPDRKDSRLSIARATVYGDNPAVGDLIAPPAPTPNASGTSDKELPTTPAEIPAETPGTSGQLPGTSDTSGQLPAATPITGSGNGGSVDSPAETPSNANANLPGPASSEDSGPPTGVIVGGVFAVVLLALLGLFVLIFMRRRREMLRQKRYAEVADPAVLGPPPRGPTHLAPLDMRSVSGRSASSSMVMPIGSPTASEGFNTMMTGSTASAAAADMFSAQQRTQYGGHQARINASVNALGAPPSEARSSVYDGCLTVESMPSTVPTQATHMTTTTTGTYMSSREEKRAIANGTASYVPVVRHEVDAGPADDVLPPTYDSVHRHR
ncbi:hypothetical protein AURDEDRAFT_168368 [Auricularia subglabra TFB-10046 SS5]|nr:hypothetical protein AURDEDRAFT_168368 [Auricularia subglabra TFB-10046 SS5]